MESRYELNKELAQMLKGGVITVSYTHLDVYKRQTQQSSRRLHLKTVKIT